MLEFARRIQARFDNAVGIDYKPLPADDPKLRRPDIGKAKRVLGWQPKIPLAEGLTVADRLLQRENPGAWAALAIRIG